MVHCSLFALWIMGLTFWVFFKTKFCKSFVYSGASPILSKNCRKWVQFLRLTPSSHDREPVHWGQAGCRVNYCRVSIQLKRQPVVLGRSIWLKVLWESTRFKNNPGDRGLNWCLNATLAVLSGEDDLVQVIGRRSTESHPWSATKFFLYTQVCRAIQK